MKITIKLTLLFAGLFSFCMTEAQTNPWQQKGLDINGEATGDQFGISVSMPDAYTVAIGGNFNDGNGASAGHVRIYFWNGSAWTQKGTDIDGEVGGDASGATVSMPDSNTVAIGAKYNDGNGINAGHVRIYTWNGTAWAQKGADIDGEVAGDYSGYAVSMPDANTIAIGARENGNNSSHAGHTRIYFWNGSAWVQKGLDLDGEAAGDYSGCAVSMPDANTVAIGASFNSDNGTNAGQVRIYTWNGSVWIQKGADLDGEAAGDYSGCAVSMPDANTVAIGATSNSGNGTNAGQVRIYSWDGSAWNQKGADIDGETAGDRSGYSVSMPDSNTVAIGEPNNSENGTNAGQVRIYSWNTALGGSWTQKGLDIWGQAAGDESGNAVSMPDSNTVAIGAYLNDQIGFYAGQARMFAIASPSSVAMVASQDKSIILYPNPSSGICNIELTGSAAVTITNSLGQIVFSQYLPAGKSVLNLQQFSTGIYFIEAGGAKQKLIVR